MPRHTDRQTYTDRQMDVNYYEFIVDSKQNKGDEREQKASNEKKNLSLFFLSHLDALEGLLLAVVPEAVVDPEAQQLQGGLGAEVIHRRHVQVVQEGQHALPPHRHVNPLSTLLHAALYDGLHVIRGGLERGGRRREREREKRERERDGEEREGEVRVGEREREEREGQESSHFKNTHKGRQKDRIEMREIQRDKQKDGQIRIYR